MADVDLMHQRMLSAFGWGQWRSNHAGIGNECTHWVYAALLEARALDSGLGIQQQHDPYTWGRLIPSSEMIAGDILQLNNFVNIFQFAFIEPSPWRMLPSLRLARSPRHTAMCGITQSHTFDGQHLVLESHLHMPGYARMTIREGRIYVASFSLAMTARQFAAARADGTIPADLDLNDNYALANKPGWLRLRDNCAIDDHVASAAFHRMAHSHDPVLPSDVAFLFRIHTTGQLRCFRPQASPARLAMDATAFAAEKRRLIAMMIRSGRHGDTPSRRHPLDEFDSDNKRLRVHDHFFDWQSVSPAGP